MPQLMPFYWVNSILMVLIILVTLIFFYYYKSLENMGNMNINIKELSEYKYLW